MKRVLETGCTKYEWMYLTLMNCRHKNGYESKFYVMYILKQLKKKNQPWVLKHTCFQGFWKRNCGPLMMSHQVESQVGKEVRMWGGW